MARAQLVSFTNFDFEDGKYRFDYQIDESQYSIVLSHTIQSFLPKNVQETVVFNLGMCYLIDLAELVVPDKIVINFSLSDKQLQFWESLYQEVAREKMYIYKLDLALLEAKWQVNPNGQSFQLSP